jgi:hypothetical protein
MPDLIPHHVPRTPEPDAQGWVVIEYRGALVRSWKYSNRLRMPGHPYDGTDHGQLGMCLKLIDYWLDHQTVPRPFVWPVPEISAVPTVVTTVCR